MSTGGERKGHRYRQLHAAQKAKGLPCYLCGQPIDYAARNPNDDEAFSLEHIKSWRDYPELRYDPANAASSHQRCNKAKGNRPLEPGLGNRSREW